MNKLAIANYRKGILTPGLHIYYCREIDDYITKKDPSYSDPKPKTKPLTKAEKAAAIQYYKANKQSPEGLFVYHNIDIDDYDVKRIKGYDVSVAAETPEIQISSPLINKIKSSKIEKDVDNGFGDNII